MPARDCDIRLTLPARAENIAIVRQVVAGLGEALSLSPQVIEDMRLAVTEACTNVVRHAYRDCDGPIEIVLQPSEDRVTVVVADRGPGLLPNPGSDGPGLGMPLIAALADQVEIEQRPAEGSRVQMSFAARRRLEAA